MGTLSALLQSGVEAFPLVAKIGALCLAELRPKAGRIANKKRQWKLFWSIVETQLDTSAAQQALEGVAAIARRSRTCLMCFERDHEICHRLRVAQELERRFGFAIEHLKVEPGFG